MKSKLVRWLVYMAAAVLSAWIFLILAVRVQAWIFRERAERLAGDVRSLRVRHTTVTQAAEMFARWHRFAVPSGKCDFKSCTHHYRVNEQLDLPPTAYGWTIRAMRLDRLGFGRPAFAEAKVVIREGFVWGTEFGLTLDVPPFKRGDGTIISYPLEARISGVPRTDPTMVTSPHPDYRWAGPDACTGCVAAFATYTPYARGRAAYRFLAINFACITRWKPCRTKADIMPGVMAQAAADHASTALDDIRCIPGSLRLVSRDAEDVAISEILGSAPNPSGPVLRLRLLQRLKGPAVWNSGSVMNLGEVDAFMVSNPNLRELSPGDLAIVVFDRNLHPRGAVPIIEEPCGLAPVTARNLELARSGIHRDDLVHLADDPPSR